MTPWVIGNWKLNPGSKQQAVELAQAIQTQLNTDGHRNVSCAILPSFVHLDGVQQVLSSSQTSTLQLGAQDISALAATTGAYTGECSAAQLADIGVQWVLVGHSERRAHLSEQTPLLIQKIQQAHAQSLGVIYCIGETQQQRDLGDTQAVLQSQLSLLEHINPIDAADIIIAYEPVWAIGTGKTPDAQQISQTHAFIRKQLAEFDRQHLPIVYGGSVNADNAKIFACSSDVNGVLVGGASLQVDAFLSIVSAFSTHGSGVET